MQKYMESWVSFYYDTCGFSIIPVQKNGKTPNIGKWKQYEYARPTKEDIAKWLKEGLFENVGVICGSVSGNLVVFDIDDASIVDGIGLDLNKITSSGCWVVQTGKGYHIYLKNIDNPGGTQKYADLKIEYRANGAYVVAPPSVHNNTKQYKFINASKPDELHVLPVDSVQKKWAELVSSVSKLKGIVVNVADLPEPITNIDADCIANILKGVSEGKRNDTAFALTQYYNFIKKLSPTETKTLITEWNNQNKPSMTQLELGGVVRSALASDSKVGCNKIRELGFCPYQTKKECRFVNPNLIARVFKEPPKDLNEVYERIRKWIYMNNTERIDLLLATAVSSQSKDKPIWIFFMGASGDAKTQILEGLDGYPNTRFINIITPNTLASGKKDEQDLGYELQNKSTIIICRDLAYLISLNRDAKSEIWSQLRELYDGYIDKDTGSGVINKKYRNCHVTLMACTTSAIKEQYLVSQELGTRELIFGTEANHDEDSFKMKQALLHRGKELLMKQEISETLQGFLSTREFDETIGIPEHIERFILDECHKLSILRASAMSTDYHKNELNADVEAEVPNRLAQQFSLIYRSLHSIDKDYPDDRFISIIKNIVRSSGNSVRGKVYGFFEKNMINWYKIPYICDIVRLGYGTVKLQCEVLWNLGMLDRKTEVETVGGFVNVDHDGYETRRGGHTQEVCYYRLHEKECKQNVLS